MKKLTQAVFENAPSYILSASICSNGEAWGSSHTSNQLKLTVFMDGSIGMANGKMFFIGDGYDTTDWQHSAIDRE